MTGPLGDALNAIATGFNASQNDVEVEAIYKGGYADVMTATIAASAPASRQIWCRSSRSGLRI